MESMTLAQAYRHVTIREMRRCRRPLWWMLVGTIIGFLLGVGL